MYKWMLFCFFTMFSILASAERIDPTKPAAYNAALDGGSDSLGDGETVADSSAMQLTYILFSDDRKIAVINGEFKKEGDMVGLYEVLQILDEKVYLKKNNEVKALEFSEPILKSVEKEEIK